METSQLLMAFWILDLRFWITEVLPVEPGGDSSAAIVISIGLPC
jgi:hypothetical protein